MLVDGTDTSLPSVPRSKGCLTCVTRKTRCDGRRPTCRACETRKQACGGYRRDQIVFLNEGWRALGVPSKSRRNGSNNVAMPNTKNSIANPSTPLTLEPLTIMERSNTTHVNGEVDPLVLYPNPAMGRSHLHIAYFLASFGTRPCQSLSALGDLFLYYLPMVSSDTSHYRRECSSLSPTAPIVLAVDALAYCHFGTANADYVSVQRSFHIYGMALQCMSARLAEMTHAGSTFANISDEDWQHFAFFCLVMAFWEMKMSPTSRNWENHLRCLAAAILLRGTDHAYSKTNFQLLASSRLLIMLQTLSAGEPNDWQQGSPIRLAWLAEVKTALGESQTPNFSADYELYCSLDTLMVDVTTIVSTMSQFNRPLSKISTTKGLENDESYQNLTDLYDKIELTLSQNEARLARWNTNVSEISLSPWLSLHQDTATDPVSACFRTIMMEPDIQSCFDTVLIFRTMLEYHSITLYWTVIMSLRLILSDMLTSMVRTGMESLPANSRQKIEDHRIQLNKYALQVLQTICYATHIENRTVGPFVFATAFQLAIAVLERECNSLQAEAGSNQNRIRRSISLKSLAGQYLDWAIQNRIPIMIDLGSLRRWEISAPAHNGR